MNPKEQIQYLLAHPEEMIKKKPFTRGGDYGESSCGTDGVNAGQKVTASLPNFRMNIITQGDYLAELDPECHKVLFDKNIPSITVKTQSGGFVEIEYKKMAIPFQRIIKNKKVQHLCGNPTSFTLMKQKPTETEIADFATFKSYWKKRNQDGMRRKFVDAVMSMGDGGLLYYFDRKGRIKARLLKYSDGFVICSHNDKNGDRLMECVYYADEENREHIDAYDDENYYHFVNDGPTENAATDSTGSGWRLETKAKHGFDEIPLVTKRGQVAWDDVQTLIEVYEVLYNVFMVIQKRHGWGILYIKGKFSKEAEKIAGAIILNDTSMDGNGSAEFKTPPNPEGMMDTLDKLEESIQKGGGATFLLPKDIKMSGDISGIAVHLTQSLDLEIAEQNATDWKPAMDKMCRLFKFGLAKELVRNGEHDTAITNFGGLDIDAAFKVWKPRNDTEYNNMLIQLAGSGLISEKTGIERNTESAPDEEVRRMAEKEEEAKKQKQEQAVSQPTGTASAAN